MILCDLEHTNTASDFNVFNFLLFCADNAHLKFYLIFT